MALIKSVRGFAPAMGNNCYLADNATIIGDVVMGDDVTIGHNVVIHGARIESHSLVGIGSVLLDHVVVGTNTIVAAGSVVLERSILEPNSLYAGIPAKRVKTVDPRRVESMIKRIASDYVMYASWYRED